MKTVLITGASRGIGEACARIFGEKGWKVYLNCRNNVKMLEELQKDIPESVVLPFDVSDRKAVFAALEGLQIDCLVNNAGVSLVSPFDAVTEEQEKALYGTDLFGVLNCSRAVLPGMIRRKSGCIINLSSMWGETGGSCEVDYSAAKGAVIALKRDLTSRASHSPGVVHWPTTVPPSSMRFTPHTMEFTGPGGIIQSNASLHNPFPNNVRIDQ